MTHDTVLIDATEYLSGRVIDDYQDLLPFEVTELKRMCSDIFLDCSITHLSASRLRFDYLTGKNYIGGGGLASTLNIQIPIESSLGIKSLLYLPTTCVEYYAICQKIFEGIIGKNVPTLSLSEHELYETVNCILSEALTKRLERESANIIIIHDFEFLPLIECIPSEIKRVLHWHVDFPTNPENQIPQLLPYFQMFDVIIAPNITTAKKIMKIHPSVVVAAPSIDPKSSKHDSKFLTQTQNFLNSAGIDLNRPILTQIGRISSQKNIAGAIKTFQHVKAVVPTAQLIIAGLYNLPGDDFSKTLMQIEKAKIETADIYLFSDLIQIKPISNDQFLNALYNETDIFLNMSRDEGFGLVITEAMWHYCPVVAIDSPGARAQINSNNDGFIVTNENEAAIACIELLNNSFLAKQLGEIAHDAVKRNFLFTRYMSEMCSIYKKVIYNS